MTASPEGSGLTSDPHRRYNPLTGQWVLVSAGRTNRPWQGQEEPPTTDERPAYDATCYLCPGNRRAGGHVNPVYDSTFVFMSGWVLVPFWGLWPFETLVVPREPASRLSDLGESASASLVRTLLALQVRYDNLFRRSFPFSMGWHQAPFVSGQLDHWQLHAHFYPPLLRSATVRKFMVGYELLSEGQRDISPEEAADRLRRLPADRYDSASIAHG